MWSSILSHRTLPKGAGELRRSPQTFALTSNLLRELRSLKYSLLLHSFPLAISLRSASVLSVSLSSGRRFRFFPLGHRRRFSTFSLFPALTRPLQISPSLTLFSKPERESFENRGACDGIKWNFSLFLLLLPLLASHSTRLRKPQNHSINIVTCRLKLLSFKTALSATKKRLRFAQSARASHSAQSNARRW